MSNVRLTLSSGGNVELPVYEASLGLPVLDIKSLIKNGYYTFDPGFMSTAACRSTITYIDGDAGVLLYRGYRIEDLAEKADYLDVVYLLMKGELPNAQEKTALTKAIQSETTLPQAVLDIIAAFPQNAHPMAMLIAGLSGLDSFYKVDVKNATDRETTIIRLVAKVPLLAAACYRRTIGKDFIVPDVSLDYAENFLYMMFGKKPSKALAKAMDRIFILHADHEQNASTSTVRMAGSTETTPFAAAAAGVAALWGPTHGGANEACLNMLKEIGSIDKIPHYIARSKDKNDNFRLMGFGHRVYKNLDPRAIVMKHSCDEVLKELSSANQPLFELAQALEKIALEDPYFIERKLFPNVDFYSGVTQSAMGIPSDMFTVVFALARMSGWMCQWSEMLGESDFKIARPRQLYEGPVERKIGH
jgi:citrate synthase